jgi:hypothetical protein
MWIWWVITPLCTANTPNWVNDNNIVFQAEPTVEYIENLQHTLQSIFNATNFYVDATGTCWCYSPPPFVYIKTIVSSEYIPLSDNTPATAFQQFYTYTLLTSLLEEYLALNRTTTSEEDIPTYLLSYKYTGPAVVETWNCSQCGSACDKTVDYSTFSTCPYCTEGSALNRCPLPKYYAAVLPSNCTHETLGRAGMDLPEWSFLGNTSITLGTASTTDDDTILLPPETIYTGRTIQPCQTAMLVSEDEGVEGGFFCFNGPSTSYTPRNFTTHPTVKDYTLLWARVDGRYGTCKEYLVTASTNTGVSMRYYGTIMDAAAAARIFSVSDALAYVESHYDLRSGLNVSVDTLESTLTPNQYLYNVFTIQPTLPVSSALACTAAQNNDTSTVNAFGDNSLLGVTCPATSQFFCPTPKTSLYGYAVCDTPGKCDSFAADDPRLLYGCPTIPTYSVTVCALDAEQLSQPLTRNISKNAAMFTLCDASQYEMLVHCITVLEGCPAISSLRERSCVCDLVNNLWCRNQTQQQNNTRTTEKMLVPDCNETHTASLQTRNSFYSLDGNLSPYQLTHPYSWATINVSTLTGTIYTSCAYPFPVPNITECSQVIPVNLDGTCHQLNKIPCEQNSDCPLTRPLCIPAKKYVVTKQDCIDARGPDASFYACATNAAVWCDSNDGSAENPAYHICNLTNIACPGAALDTRTLTSGCLRTNIVSSQNYCTGSGRLCTNDGDCVGPGKQLCDTETGTCVQACFADYNTIIPIPSLTNAYREGVIEKKDGLFDNGHYGTFIVASEFICDSAAPTCMVSDNGDIGYCSNSCTSNVDCIGDSLCIGTEVFITDLLPILTENDCTMAGGVNYAYCEATGVTYCDWTTHNTGTSGYTPCTGTTALCTGGYQYNACPTAPSAGTTVIIENGQCSVTAGPQYYIATPTKNTTTLNITFYEGDLCTNPDTNCNGGQPFEMDTIQPSIYINRGHPLQCANNQWVNIKPDVDLRPPTEEECSTYIAPNNRDTCEYEYKECQSVVMDRENIEGIAVSSVLTWIEANAVDNVDETVRNILSVYISDRIHAYGIRRLTTTASTTSAIIMNQNILSDFLRMQYYGTIQAWNTAYPAYPLHGPSARSWSSYTFWLFVQNYTVDEQRDDANVFEEPCGFIACNLCLPTYTMYNKRLQPDVYIKETGLTTQFRPVPYAMEAVFLTSIFYMIATTQPIPCGGYVAVNESASIYVTVSYQACTAVCTQGYVCDGVPNAHTGSDCNLVTNITLCTLIPGCMVCTPGAFIIPPSPPPYTPIYQKRVTPPTGSVNHAISTGLLVMRIIYLVVGSVLSLCGITLVVLSIKKKKKLS